MIDDAINSDDWVDYNFPGYSNTVDDNKIKIVDMEDFHIKEKKSLEIKHDKEKTTACKSSKKSEKISPEMVKFEKLLEGINYKILNDKLKKFHQFLESNTIKEMCLPYASKEFEDIFKSIVQNTGLLRSQRLYNTYRDTCNKIMNTVHLNKSVFFLSYLYEQRNINNIMKKVLVIKKVYFTKESVDNVSLSSSLGSLLPSSESSSELDPEELLKRSLVFEKVVKGKPAEITVNSDQIINPQQMIPEKRNVKFISKSEKCELQRQVFLNGFHRPFVLRALNAAINFLSDEKALRVSFAPKSSEEQKFYRSIINWGRMAMVPTSDPEYKRLLEKVAELLRHMKVRVPSSKKNQVNIKNGIREVTYIKKIKNMPPPDLSTAQRKNKKIKLQDVINSDRLPDIPITDLLNKSKIDFKPAATKSGATNEPLDKDREASLEGHKELPVESPPKRSKEEVIQCVRSSMAERQTSRYHQKVQVQRKERLLEALSVPVQSEKAMKMMRGMGWSGGALGARGNGITEPIMPALERLSGAGFGLQHKHLKPATKKITKRKVSKLETTTKIGSNWLSEGPIEPNQALEADVIVQKTKQLLQENITFDTLIKSDIKTTAKELPDIKYFRRLILNSILHIVSKDETVCLFKYISPLSRKHRTFLKQMNKALKRRCELMIPEAENEVLVRILERINNLPGVEIQASVSRDYKEVELKKLKIFSDDQMKQLNVVDKETKSYWPEQIMANDNSMMDFINALEPTGHSKRAFQAIKFRVLILLNILHFVRSDDEELEVSFNKIIPMKQRNYIESTIESVNSRLRFGSTPSESGLAFEIKNYIGDNFIGIFFNHRYTSFSLIKYSRSITSKKSAGVARPKRKTSLDLDDFMSDSSSDTLMATEIPNKNIDYNNDDVEKNGKKDNASASLISKEAADNKKVYIKEEEDAINQVAANNNAIDENSRNQIKDKGLTDMNVKEKIDMNIEIVDCNEDIVVDCTDNSEVIAKNYAGADDDKISDEVVTETIDSIGYKVAEKNNRDIDKQNNDEGEGENDKYIEDMEILALEKDNPIIDKDIDSEKSNDLESMESDYSCIVTSIINGNEVIDILDDEDIEEVSDELNIDAVMVGFDTHKQMEVNCNDIINIIDDDDFEEGSGKEDVININDQMEMDDEVIKLDGDASAAKITNDNEINKDSSLQDICVDDSGKEIIQDDLISKINGDDAVTDKSERNQLLLKGIDMVNESLQEIKTRESMDEEKSANAIDSDIVETNVNKNDGDITRTIDLYECNCDDEYSEDSDLKTAYIVPTNYPNENINRDKAKQIQTLFSDNIFKGKELPLLMCHGVQNGALLYSCHRKNTLNWVINTISAASDFKVLNAKAVRKLALKCYSIFDIDVNNLFSMLELYNKDLSTKEWVVEKTENCDNYVIYIVKMDPHSVNIINASDLCLFAGIDKVKFSIVWD